MSDTFIDPHTPAGSDDPGVAAFLRRRTRPSGQNDPRAYAMKLAPLDVLEIVNRIHPTLDCACALNPDFATALESGIERTDRELHWKLEQLFRLYPEARDGNGSRLCENSWSPSRRRRIIQMSCAAGTFGADPARIPPLIGRKFRDQVVVSRFHTASVGRGHSAHGLDQHGTGADDTPADDDAKILRASRAKSEACRKSRCGAIAEAVMTGTEIYAELQEIENSAATKLLKWLFEHPQYRRRRDLLRFGPKKLRRKWMLEPVLAELAAQQSIQLLPKGEIVVRANARAREVRQLKSQR